MRSFRTASLGALGLLALAACGSTGNSSLFGSGTGATASVGASGGAAAEGGSVGVSGGGSGGVTSGGAGNANAGGTLGTGASLGAGGAPGSGGQLIDAAVPNPRDSGSTPFGVATPGTIFCAGVACTITAFPPNTCCIGGPPFPTECLPSFPGCVNGGVAQISCDDATDCSNGQVCCGTLNNKLLNASCATACNNSAFEVCRTDAECPSRRCEPIQDTPDYGQCN